jgi:rod shape determining protein RodA
MRLGWLARRSTAGPAPRTGLAALLPRWRELDWNTLFLALSILGIGMMFVRAMALADADLGRPDRWRAHLLKLAIALPCIGAGLFVRPRWLRRNAWRVYGACLALLALLPFVGSERNNARRWIELPFGFDLQPSELAKLGILIALARALSRNRLERGRDWLPPLALALVPMGLVAMQPDLGTALTIVPVTLGMVYLAGARMAVLVRFALAAALLALIALQLGMGVKDYQRERLDTWLGTYAAAPLIEARRGPAFHAYFARLTIGHGGWSGTGLGRGIASETGLLPERDSDSIFAVVAEEAGFLGATGLLVLYSLLILSLMASAAKLRDRFTRLVVGGIALYFGAHVFIHVGVNTGLLPMTGLTLPLLSTGGSSLLATCLALGLALGLSARHEPALDQDAFRSY